MALRDAALKRDLAHPARSFEKFLREQKHTRLLQRKLELWRLKKDRSPYAFSHYFGAVLLRKSVTARCWNSDVSTKLQLFDAASCTPAHYKNEVGEAIGVMVRCVELGPHTMHLGVWVEKFVRRAMCAGVLTPHDFKRAMKLVAALCSQEQIDDMFALSAPSVDVLESMRKCGLTPSTNALHKVARFGAPLEITAWLVENVPPVWNDDLSGVPGFKLRCLRAAIDAHLQDPNDPFFKLLNEHDGDGVILRELLKV